MHNLSPSFNLGFTVASHFQETGIPSANLIPSDHLVINQAFILSVSQAIIHPSSGEEVPDHRLKICLSTSQGVSHDLALIGSPNVATVSVILGSLYVDTHTRTFFVADVSEVQVQRDRCVLRCCKGVVFVDVVAHVDAPARIGLKPMTI